MAKLTCNVLWDKLKDAGFNMPDDVSRIVIDVKVCQAIKVYYETYASEKMLDVVVETLMQNKKDIVIEKVD